MKIFPQRISDSLTQSISDGSGCRTAPATPGLVTISKREGEGASKKLLFKSFCLVYPNLIMTQSIDVPIINMFLCTTHCVAGAALETVMLLNK